MASSWEAVCHIQGELTILRKLLDGSLERQALAEAGVDPNLSQVDNPVSPRGY